MTPGKKAKGPNGPGRKVERPTDPKGARPDAPKGVKANGATNPVRPNGARNGARQNGRPNGTGTPMRAEQGGAGTPGAGAKNGAPQRPPPIAEPEKKGFSLKDLTSYYTFNLISVVILTFLAGVMVVLTALAFMGLSWDIPVSAQNLVPGSKSDLALVLSVGTILVVLDALLHFWDRKVNIMASILLTVIMVIGLGREILFPNPGQFADVYAVFFLLVAIMLMDVYIIALKKYPVLLEEHSRMDLPDVISRFEELQRTIGDLESKLAEEEEKVKTRAVEIESLKSELVQQKDEMAQEEEKLSTRMGETSKQRTELAEEEEELAAEEEKLRLKRTEFEITKTELSSDRLVEEEERLRIKGEELFDTKVKLDREGRQLAQEEERLAKQGVEVQIKKRTIEDTFEDLSEEEEHLKNKSGLYSKVKQHMKEFEELEEEETLRGMQKKIDVVEQEMGKADMDWMVQETESLKKKEGRLSQVMGELEERYKEIGQKELEISRMKDRWRAEEVEKLRKKEEELFAMKNETEVKSRVAEELRKELKAKETELHAIKTEYEKQMRKKIEEEEMLKVRDVSEKEREKHKAKRTLYPFTAIVGQDAMKKTLVLNAINPLIGGVLIRGQKGTAKSVSVRGLAEVLPEIDAVAGCRYNCDPADEENLCDECKVRKGTGRFNVVRRPIRVIDLPLNVTEDRLIGSIDIEKILREGKKAFEPGLFAECHRGILYVDEINLLDDYVVDLLLDAAAMGIVHVEREGISVAYLSRFIIVGSMNPEEGELRPQILDRIALQAEVAGIQEVTQRVEIVRRREEFTKDSEVLRRRYQSEQDVLKARITQARELLPKVSTSEPIMRVISNLCIDFDAAGHRADIIIERTARTNAALQGRVETSLEDVSEAAVLALPHRMRANPIEGEPFTHESILKRLRKYQKEAS